jgi:hypothetical protein
MNSSINTICGTALLITILIGVFVLAYQGMLTGAETVGILTAIIGIAGGAFAVQQGAKIGAEAANTIPSTVAAQIEAQKE